MKGFHNLENEKNRQKKKSIIFFIIIVLLLGIIAIFAIGTMLSKEDKETTSGAMKYETNVVVDDAKALQDAVDELFEKTKEGQMSLEMQTEANSKDGKKFTCYLANSNMNSYDMFMVFYRDDTQEEIYRTGLIQPGARIEEFTLDKQLEPGNYDVTIVYNQVEEDMQTIHAQVNVGLTLVVK